VTAERTPEEILRAWGRSGMRPDDSARSAARRDRAVIQIAQQITLAAEERLRRARLRFRAGLVCAVAAAVAIVFGARGMLRSHSEPGPAAAIPAVGELHGADEVMVLHASVEHHARAMPLVPGDEVRTPAEARTRVVLTEGAQATVEPRSRLVVGGAGSDALELLAGELSVHVPKLIPPRTFSVRTPDARVVVHGTRFVVTVLDAPARPRTRVRVIEGRVGVEYQGEAKELVLGQRWPAAPEAAQPTADSAPNPEPRDVAPAPPQLPSAKPSSSAPSRKAAALVSEAALAEQNRLFSAAVAASRRGDDSRAVALIDELLVRYPTSPLVPEARVERFRALKRLGHKSEAAREASRYLLENENGAARDEAREVVLPDPQK
jgi:hypothetical protein